MSCNTCVSRQLCSCGLTFTVDGTYLAPYLGNLPLEPVDLQPLIQEAETDTRLQLDIPNNALVYTGERAGNGGTADSIGIDILAGLINLSDLKNVENTIPTDGALLVYSETATKWQSRDVTDDVLVSAIGYDSDGNLRRQDVTALTQAPIDNSPRIYNIVTAATLTFDLSQYDQFNVSAQAGSITLASPGVNSDGRSMIIRLHDNGTSHAINYNAIFRFIGVTQPTVTVPNKMLYLGAKYNAQDAKWDILAIGRE